jgi:hypothetical protein
LEVRQRCSTLLNAAALRASTPHIGSLSAPTVADLDTQQASAAGSLMSNDTCHMVSFAGTNATALLPRVTHVVLCNVLMAKGLTGSQKYADDSAGTFHMCCISDHADLEDRVCALEELHPQGHQA